MKERLSAWFVRLVLPLMWRVAVLRARWTRRTGVLVVTHGTEHEVIPVQGWGEAWNALKLHMPTMDRVSDKALYIEVWGRSCHVVDNFEAVRYRFGM